MHFNWHFRRKPAVPSGAMRCVRSIPCSISTAGEGSASYVLSISQGLVWWEEPRVSYGREKDRFCQSFRSPPGWGSDWPPPPWLPDQPRPRARAGGPLQVRGAGGARGGRNRAWFRTRGGFPERQWNSEVAPDLEP